ncbi:hypothetical protein [Microvirga makkahensis]|uniref:Uncharacterized protein n=1 Tax=Microvirga makkahensis TaxID=1128670 RepID=A0A7X3MNK0_9HYPH|nr:hypothetical protein [Microvirga makkahensis]MXQ10267.1 hypothetical protein [Microvirga makkahensis]
MRKLIQKALLRHFREQGEFSGALLITFKDGRPQMTGLIDDDDQAAEALIMAVMNAIETPDSDDEDYVDTIGPCVGEA